ncbi:MAG TPA: hypothetical protein VGY52_00395, partial [Roseiarcus sp.]|nr:hypothetical protein [Roseiarcus sp.]
MNTRPTRAIGAAAAAMASLAAEILFNGAAPRAVNPSKTMRVIERLLQVLEFFAIAGAADRLDL